MNILASLTEINYLPILVGVIASMIWGFIWYSNALFGKAWMHHEWLSKDDVKQSAMWRVLLRAFVALFVIGITMAIMFADSGLLQGIQMWLLFGVGIVAMNTAVHYTFAQKSFPHYLIVVGHDIITFVILGAIIGGWQFI